MTIVVQGEHYETAEDLAAAIEKLLTDAENMPQHTPEHEALARHTQTLADAYKEATGEYPPVVGEHVREVGSDEPEPEPGHLEPELEPAATEAEGANESAFCPVCGHELEDEIPVPLDPRAGQCPDCNGFGKVLTGSRVTGHVVRDCQKCQGQGWIENYSAEPLPASPDPIAEQAVWPDARRGEDGLWLPAVGQAPPWEGAQWNPRIGGWQ